MWWCVNSLWLILFTDIAAAAAAAAAAACSINLESLTEQQPPDDMWAQVGAWAVWLSTNAYYCSTAAGLPAAHI
jgi:hypothetical protein